MNEIKNLFEIVRKLGLYGKPNNNLKSIFVPHAGYTYSGVCAAIPFTYIPKTTKRIILICTNHNNKEISNNQDKLDGEASYGKTISFINELFPEVLVEAYIVGTFDINFSDKILKKIKNNLKNNTVIVYTSDLTHYGKSYNYTGFPKPQQFYAIKNEEKLIEYLKEGKFYDDFSRINAGGKEVIKMMSYINNKLSLFGKVVCYHTSASVNYDNFLDTLTLQPNSEHFVSYLGMIFTTNKIYRTCRFDDLQLLASAKSTLEFRVKNINFDIKNQMVPSWSLWNKRFQGAFVGISNGEKIRASRGHYESKRTNTSYNVVSSAYSCYQDAIDRWGGAITKKELPELKYQINLLDPKKEWVHYTYKEFMEKNPMIRCVDGIYITTEDGYSATYLPSVWCKRPHWSAETLLKELLDKSGGTSLNNSIILLYKTKLLF